MNQQRDIWMNQRLRLVWRTHENNLCYLTVLLSYILMTMTAFISDS